MIRVVANPMPGGAGQPFVIADGTGQRGPGGRMLVDDLTGTFDAVSQDNAYFRGPALEFFDRLNESGTMDLVAEYEFADEAETFLFVLGLQSAVPRQANISIGVDGAQKTLGGAIIRPIRYQTIGIVALRVTYPIRFGLIT